MAKLKRIELGIRVIECDACKEEVHLHFEQNTCRECGRVYNKHGRKLLSGDYEPIRGETNEMPTN